MTIRSGMEDEFWSLVLHILGTRFRLMHRMAYGLVENRIELNAIDGRYHAVFVCYSDERGKVKQSEIKLPISQLKSTTQSNA